MKRIDELFKPLILILSLLVFVWYALTTRYEYYVVPGVPDSHPSYALEVDTWTNKTIWEGTPPTRLGGRPLSLHEGEPKKSNLNRVRPDFGALNPDVDEKLDPARVEFLNRLFDLNDSTPASYDPKQVARDYAIFDSARKAAEQEQTQGRKP